MSTVQLSEEFINQARETVKSILRERVPKMDLRRGGPLNDLLLNGVALGLALIEQRISEFEATQSLNSLQVSGTDLTTIDDSVIDAILSNWFITRKKGSQSKGLVRVILSTKKLYFIPRSQQFVTLDGVIFQTTQEYTVQPEGLNVPADSLVLHPLDEANSLYFVIVPVTAQSVGLNDLSAGTALDVPSSFDINYVTSEAFSDFDGGSEKEDTTTLVGRSEDAISARNNLSRKAIRATLTEQFANIRDISVIGYGDREELRDITRGLSVHVGGKIDSFVRTSSYPSTKVLTKKFDEDGKIVLSAFSETPDPFPIYQVLGVFLQADAERFLNYSNFSFDNSKFTLTREPQNEFFTVANVPDVTLAPLATRYTLLEKITIQAKDIPTYANQDAVVVIQGMFEIANIYKSVIDDSERSIAADHLVRAPAPCFINFKLKYALANVTTVLDQPGLITALHDHINSIPMGTPLVVSQLVDIAHNYGVTKVMLPLTVNGVLYQPNDVILPLSAQDTLVTPTIYSIGMSPRTTAFFVRKEDILLEEVVI